MRQAPLPLRFAPSEAQRIALARARLVECAPLRCRISPEACAHNQATRDPCRSGRCRAGVAVLEQLGLATRARCPSCSGTGRIALCGACGRGSRCPTCGGSGRVTAEVRP